MALSLPLGVLEKLPDLKLPELFVDLLLLSSVELVVSLGDLVVESVVVLFFESVVVLFFESLVVLLLESLLKEPLLKLLVFDLPPLLGDLVELLVEELFEPELKELLLKLLEDLPPLDFDFADAVISPCVNESKMETVSSTKLDVKKMKVNRNTKTNFLLHRLINVTPKKNSIFIYYSKKWDLSKVILIYLHLF
ncbi:MAG: hypothetical protein ACRDA5_13010 [Clostridium sp.]